MFVRWGTAQTEQGWTKDMITSRYYIVDLQNILIESIDVKRRQMFVQLCAQKNHLTISFGKKKKWK